MLEFTTNLATKKIKDPLTGEYFIPKHLNQRFACRGNQIKYNNLKAREIRLKKEIINNALENNRKIIEKILKNKESEIVSDEYLLGAGFNFNYFTHYKRINDDVVAYIFNYSIKKSHHNSYKISKI
jgi:hypothetical protein